MQLSNTTAVPAQLVVVQLPFQPTRHAQVWAKATYQWNRGDVQLVTQDPDPLLDDDTPSPLGLLPRDNLPRRDAVLEVILLGHAHAKTPVKRLEPALSVGGERRTLLVHGDRRWESGFLGRKSISAPEPFTTMPLTWERCYGGTVPVEIDRESFMSAVDPRNAAGRGFDAARFAEGLAKHLRCPKPYPKFDPTRLLPNVEDPAKPISKWEDDPDPLCWATVPPASALNVPRMMKDNQVQPGVYHRAHPTWVIAPPPAGAEVKLHHLTDTIEESFALPTATVWCDVLAGGETSSHQLQPQVLVLQPDQRRFTLLYKAWFPVAKLDGMERAARVRVQ